MPIKERVQYGMLTREITGVINRGHGITHLKPTEIDGKPTEIDGRPVKITSVKYGPTSGNDELDEVMVYDYEEFLPVALEGGRIKITETYPTDTTEEVPIRQETEVCLAPPSRLSKRYRFERFFDMFDSSRRPYLQELYV
jgi:hypothetical protein